MRRILRKILAGEEDSLGDTSTVSPCFSSKDGKRKFVKVKLIVNSYPTQA